MRQALIGLILLSNLLAQDFIMRRRAAAAGGGGGLNSFSDDFNRADGSPGANWTVAAGSWNIGTNQLRNATTGFASTFLIYSATATGSATQYIKITIPNDGGAYCGIILRYANSSSPFYVLYHDQTAIWEWYTYANVSDGSPALVGSGDAGTFNDGDSYGITISGTGTSTVIRFWLNPTANTPVSSTEWDSGDTTPDLTLTNDPATACDTGQYIGISAASGTSNVPTYDNFYGGGTT